MDSRNSSSMLPRPFFRGAELQDISRRLLQDDCRAIVLSSGIGMGATSLLRKLVQSPPSNAPVISIQGTPSLSGIPFGVLAPFLQQATSEFVSSGFEAIREILVFLDEQEAEILSTLESGAEVGTPLLVIDGADFMDSGTAEVAVRLVLAGRVKIVLSHSLSNSLVEPLPRLWEEGLAEKVQLQPLTLDEANDYCRQVLQGRITDSSAWYFWSVAGGNPLFMWLVMSDARTHGWLKQRDGVWIAETKSLPRSRELEDVVREQLRGISATGRQTLNLVALSEPVSVDIIADILGVEPIQELRDRRLIHESGTAPRLLQLANPIYGEVIRNIVPRGESTMLHRKLIGRVQNDGSSPQALLRRVSWALDNGENVPEDRILLAALYACKLFQSHLALKLASLVHGADHALRVRCIKARAHYNMGEYRAAAELLEGTTQQADNVSDLLFGAMLHFAVRSALGCPLEQNQLAANTMRATGERLAVSHPQTAAAIRMQVNERADVLEIMSLSLSGGYREQGELTQKALAVPVRPDDPDFWLNRAVVLALEGERLSALGRPVAGLDQAARALAIPQSEGHDVTFLPELILGRLQTAALSAGEWDQVQQILGEPNVKMGPSVVAFSGSSSVAQGMLLLRQGRDREAAAVLLSGVESLRISDPQQLLGYCTAMAAYVASKLGRHQVAGTLLEQYGEGNAMFVVATHERAFVAAARGHLHGGGLAELLELGDAAAAAGHRLAELNALALAVDFDVDATAPRLQRAAREVEGRWAFALETFAGAIEAGTADAAVAAGEKLLEYKLFQLAATAFAVGERHARAGHQRALAQRARSCRTRAMDAMGVADDSGGTTESKVDQARTTLTKREFETAVLAVKGMSDQKIAAKLRVSVRTVEGHLHRGFGKLGITSRSELSRVLPER